MQGISTRRLVIHALAVLLFVLFVFTLNDIFNAEWKGLLEIASHKEETALLGAAGTIYLVHVLSPHVVPDADERFYPLDLNQWAAMGSIRRALLDVPEPAMQVEFVCVVSDSELEILSQAGLPCQRFETLKRSTRTRYPRLEPQIDLPFIGDIVDSATRDLTEANASFHVLITNADIGLSKRLYGTLYKFLQKFDAVSINRMTIPKDQITAFTNETDLLENQVDSLLSAGTKHPGYDFFCISSSVLDRISFGDFFLGRPTWGANVHLMMKIMADRYINIKSNPYGTFHLGNNKTNWDRPNDYELDRISKVFRHFCPIAFGAVVDELSAQNVMNCAKWFLGDRDLRYISKNDSVYVPGFVRPGFENLYLQRYPNYLAYGAWGIPEVLRGQKPKG